VVYGGEGRGKTTLLSKFPNLLALLLERGLPRGVTMDAVAGVDNFEAVMATLREFYTNPGEYKTLGIDTVDAFEPMVLEHVCAEHRWKNIEQGAYGKGYVFADDRWRRLLTALTAIRDKHSVSIVMTCHAVVERIDDPRAPTYTAYAPKLHKRARGLVMDACDAVFFVAEDLRTVTDDRERTRASAGAGRNLFTEGRPAFAAKNRYGMPEKVPLPHDLPISELIQYWSS
jgi:AAA domain